MLEVGRDKSSPFGPFVQEFLSRLFGAGWRSVVETLKSPRANPARGVPGNEETLSQALCAWPGVITRKRQILQATSQD